MLSAHPAVRECVVVALQDSFEHKRLVSYVVPHDGTTVDAGELRIHASEKLPEYMVPSHIVVLNSFPLTPNGKLDKQALPAPDWSLPELDGSYIPPRTQREMLLVQIWSEVLGVKHIGIDDNFFELGGDSILSIQIIARANRAGLQLIPRQLFQHPTVAGLAAVAGTTKGNSKRAGRGEWGSTADAHPALVL